MQYVLDRAHRIDEVKAETGIVHRLAQSRRPSRHRGHPT
jgi:hypothetical protein